MTKFHARALTSCIPISRSQLFEDLTQTESKQTVRNVWMVPGHVFVSLENGTKLITFDCRPVIHHHNIGSSTLDFPTLESAIIEIFISPLSPNIAHIVQQNGHVHSWQFSSTYQWSSLCEFDLCKDSKSEILSIGLHPKHNIFYWCECPISQTPTYRICKALPRDGQQDQNKHNVSDVIVEDCPAAEVFPMGDSLLIVPRYKEDQTRLCILWQPSFLGLVSVTTVTGSTVRDHHDMRSPLVFSEVVLNCLSDFSQDTPCGPDMGAKQDLVTGNVVLLHLNGTVQTFSCTENEIKLSVAVKSMEITMPESLLKLENLRDVWNIHKNIIAIATNTNTMRDFRVTGQEEGSLVYLRIKQLYGAQEGHLIHELEMDAGISIRSLVHVRSPVLLVGMVTSSGVLVLQAGKISTSRPAESQTLPNDKHFQTDALQVALLAQQREENPSQHITEQLKELHKKWVDLQAHQPRTELSDTVDAYLAEFWRLEEQANNLGKSQEGALTCVYDTRQMVRDAVSRSRGMAPDTAMAELLWLSHKYPIDMLSVLLGDLDVQKDELTAEDQGVWQSTLGLDSADGQAQLQHRTITFELICRLLYQEQPDSLVSFVRNVQMVSEQAVGVSAFVRRKDTMQYYIRAMECLPEPNNSKYPQKAASAKAQIILKGAPEHGPELALRFLLRHSQWSEAIMLLQGLDADSSQHSSLFFLLLQHLLQAQALTDYASEVFSLISSWKNFLPAMKVMGDNSDSQHGTTAPSLFFSGKPDIPLSALRPHLMTHLKKDSKK